MCVSVWKTGQLEHLPRKVQETVHRQSPGGSVSISCCLSLIISVIATDLSVVFGLTGQPQPTDSGGGAGHSRDSAQPCWRWRRGVWEVSVVPVCARPDPRPWPSPSLRFQLRPFPAASPHVMKPPSVAPRSPPPAPQSHSFPPCRQSLRPGEQVPLQVSSTSPQHHCPQSLRSQGRFWQAGNR